MTDSSANRGIDGRLYFHDNRNRDSKQIMFSPSPQSAYLLSIIGMEYSQGAALAEATQQGAGN